MNGKEGKTGNKCYSKEITKRDEKKITIKRAEMRYTSDCSSPDWARSMPGTSWRENIEHRNRAKFNCLKGLQSATQEVGQRKIVNQGKII